MRRNMALLEHQRVATRWICEKENKQHRGMRGGIVSLSMGLGKTLVTLWTIAHTRAQQTMPTLVLCPKSLITNWGNDCNKFFGKTLRVLFYHPAELKRTAFDTLAMSDLATYDFVVTTYDVCRTTRRKYDEFIFHHLQLTPRTKQLAAAAKTLGHGPKNKKKDEINSSSDKETGVDGGGEEEAEEEEETDDDSDGPQVEGQMRSRKPSSKQAEGSPPKKKKNKKKKKNQKNNDDDDYYNDEEDADGDEDADDECGGSPSASSSTATKTGPLLLAGSTNSVAGKLPPGAPTNGQPLDITKLRGPVILFAVDWFRIVADESQTFANHKGSLLHALLSLRSERKLCLTGTPVRNYSTDLLAQFKFCNLSTPVSTRGGSGRNKWSAELCEKLHLRNNILMMDYETAQVTLPPKNEYNVEIHLEYNAKKIYDLFFRLCARTLENMESSKSGQGGVFSDNNNNGDNNNNDANDSSNSSNNGDKQSRPNFGMVLATFTRLRQVCLAPFLLHPNASALKSSDFYGSSSSAAVSGDNANGASNCGAPSVTTSIITTTTTTTKRRANNNARAAADNNDNKDNSKQKSRRKNKVNSSTNNDNNNNNNSSSIESKDDSNDDDAMDEDEDSNNQDDQEDDEEEQDQSTWDRLLGENVAHSRDRAELEELRTWTAERTQDAGFYSQKFNALVDIMREHMKIVPVTHPGYVRPVGFRDGESDVTKHAHKVIVFSSFTRAIVLFALRLKAEGFQERAIALVDGSLDPAEREAQWKRFRSDPDCQILLMTYKVGSEGVTLTEADHVAFLEPWWCPSVKAQAVARSWRIGQCRPVHIWNFVIAESIENRILTVGAEKDAMSADLLHTGKGNASSKRAPAKTSVKSCGVALLKYILT